MRPSCPPPSSPSQEPEDRRATHAARRCAQSGRVMLRAFSVCVARNCGELHREVGVAGREHRDREQRRVARHRPRRWRRSPPGRRAASARWTAASPRRAGTWTGPARRAPATTVLEASMPGRCAAPPAPAMMACRPRSRALSAYANISSGVRCADSTFASNETPNSFRIVQACCITSQSELEPITTPIDAVPLREVIVAGRSAAASVARAAGKGAIVASGGAARGRRRPSR